MRVALGRWFASGGCGSRRRGELGYDHDDASFAIAWLLCGVLHIQLLLSHAYMPRFTRDEQRELGWIRYQVIGTQNVDTSWYDGWFHGGLQYQVEHHLFPRVPRHNLPKLTPLVREFCARHNLPYNTDPFLTCVADMVRCFYRESRVLVEKSKAQ